MGRKANYSPLLALPLVLLDRSTALHKNINSNISSNSSSSSSDAKTSSQTTTELTLRMNTMETELKQVYSENKRLRMEMEKTKKRLALERKLSESYLMDLEKARGEVAQEMVKNVSMVRVFGFYSLNSNCLLT